MRSPIFVIDDHPVMIEAIGQTILSMGDFNVISACSATEMRSFLDSDNYDGWNIRLIVLDINLPEANGIELIPLLISRCGIPILVMSGGDDDGLTLNACIKKGHLVSFEKCSGLICADTSIGGKSTLRGEVNDKRTQNI